MWRTATIMEHLIGDAHIRMKKKTLKTAAPITIATWLDELHDLRRKIPCRKTTNTIMSCATPEELRKADIQLKRKLKEQEAQHYGQTDRELGNELWARQQRNLMINNQDRINIEN